MQIITSLQNQWVKQAAGLKQKKHRDAEGLFLLEGVRLIEEAVRNHWPLRYCLVNEAAQTQTRVQMLLGELSAIDCNCYCVPATVYEKVADTQESQGIVAVAAQQTQPLPAAWAGKPAPLFVILDAVQDPGNVGTLIRTAAAAGCQGVFLTKGCADVFAPKTVRATMGGLFAIPVWQGLNTEELLALLKNWQVQLLATALEDAKVYVEADLTGAAAIVFGNEGNGVSPALLAAAAERLYIPLIGTVESLNVAASAAVLLYEAWRQRR